MSKKRPEHLTTRGLLARFITEQGEDVARQLLLSRLEFKATQVEIDAAREAHGADDISIDQDATTSRYDGGTWVSAWVWVEYPKCYKCTNSRDEYPTFPLGTTHCEQGHEL